MYNSSEVWARFENENPYTVLLKDNRWQELRLKVIERDKGRCQMCDFDGGDKLHVHHKRYIKGNKPWEYDMDMLISVCARCHRKHHGIKKKSKRKKKSKPSHS